MPKMKTRKAAAKRIRVTRNGKMLHAKGTAGHLRGKKSYRARKAKHVPRHLSPAFVKRVRAMLNPKSL